MSSAELSAPTRLRIRLTHSRLTLAFEQEIHNLRYNFTRPAVEFFVCEIGNRVRHGQIFVIRQAPGHRHGTARGVEYIRNERSGRNSMFFKNDAVEHTARAARASIADPGYHDIAVGLDLVDDLLMRRDTGIVLARQNMTARSVFLL